MLECGSAVKSWQCESSGLAGRKIHSDLKITETGGLSKYLIFNETVSRVPALLP